MKILTREDIDMSVQDDPELVRRRKEARRELHDAMKKTWTDLSKQPTERKNRETEQSQSYDCGSVNTGVQQ
jgi:hypothetical protein